MKTTATEIYQADEVFDIELYNPVKAYHPKIEDIDLYEGWAFIRKGKHLINVEFEYSTEIEPYHSATWEHPAEGGEMTVNLNINKISVVLDEWDYQREIKRISWDIESLIEEQIKEN